MFKKARFRTTLLLVFCLFILVGCQTTKGIIEGIPKDIQNTWKALCEADEWLRKNLW